MAEFLGIFCFPGGFGRFFASRNPKSRRGQKERKIPENNDSEDYERNPFDVLNKMSSEQVRFAKPLAREYFLAKAIDFCSMGVVDFYKADIIEFPERGFSPEARRETEERSPEGFVKLYNMVASGESLREGLRVVNSALKEFEERFVRRFAEEG